jgi:hypothetical protein
MAKPVRGKQIVQDIKGGRKSVISCSLLNELEDFAVFLSVNRYYLVLLCNDKRVVKTTERGHRQICQVN